MALPVRVVNCGTIGDREFAGASRGRQRRQRQHDDTTTTTATTKRLTATETSYTFQARLFHGWMSQLPRANFCGYWIFSQHVASMMPTSRCFDRSLIASRNEFPSDSNIQIGIKIKKWRHTKKATKFIQILQLNCALFFPKYDSDKDIVKQLMNLYFRKRNKWNSNKRSRLNLLWSHKSFLSISENEARFCRRNYSGIDTANVDKLPTPAGMLSSSRFGARKVNSTWCHLVVVNYYKQCNVITSTRENDYFTCRECW